MSENYTIRSMTSAGIKKGLCKISLPKMRQTSMHTTSFCLVEAQIKQLLTTIFNLGPDGPSMAMLLEATENTLTNCKNTDT